MRQRGGIYKDVDDTQIKGFGDIKAPGGIAFNQEYAADRLQMKDSAIPNTPIAAVSEHPVINLTLEMAEENYINGEENILKLAGPDVLTNAVYKYFPNSNPKANNARFSQWDEIKQNTLKKRDATLTLDEINLLIKQNKQMRALNTYVENGRDHSWA